VSLSRILFSESITKKSVGSFPLNGSTGTSPGYITLDQRGKLGFFHENSLMGVIS
jgi:hypothetical protein